MREDSVLAEYAMTIDAEKRRYRGESGWNSDPILFAKVAVTFQQWIGHAGEHMYAARVLLPHVMQRFQEIEQLIAPPPRTSVRVPPSLTGIYFLHCAFSVENSLKGVIIQSTLETTRQAITRTRRIPKALLGHDLCKLASRAKYEFGTDEEYVLTFLSRYSTWAGRYPLPVTNMDNALTRKLSNGGNYMMASYSPGQVPSFFKFAESVYSWALRAAPPATETGTAASQSSEV